jgi:hypothetical protein
MRYQNQGQTGHVSLSDSKANSDSFHIHKLKKDRLYLKHSLSFFKISISYFSTG